MGSDWVADITANSWRLDNLAHRSTGYDVRLWVEEDDSAPRFYFWASPHLDVSTDVKVVQDRAAALRALWHGVLYVHYENYTPLRLSVLHRDNCPIADFELGDPNSDPFAPEVLSRPRRKLPSWENPLDDNVELAMALARHDLGVRHRLQALGISGVTMPTLFLLHDDMAKVAKWSNDDIDKYGEADTPVAQRFQATVNNPTASGPQSRHGGPGTKPSKAAPASLAEARPVILKAYGRYLMKRADDIGLAQLV
ncbi:MAG: hypothetical protein ACYDD1_15470 [Caulobacteraceae bacterium]